MISYKLLFFLVNIIVELISNIGELYLYPVNNSITGVSLLFEILLLATDSIAVLAKSIAIADPISTASSKIFFKTNKRDEQASLYVYEYLNQRD